MNDSTTKDAAPPADFRDVIARLGGPAQVAEILGLSVTHAHVLKYRNSISPRFWERIEVAAAALGLPGMTRNDCLAIHNRRSGAARGDDYGT